MKQFLIFLILFFLLQSCDWNNGEEGYERDLVPIKSEVNKIADYEKVALLILNNKTEIEKRIKLGGNYSNYQIDDDSIFSYAKNDLNLRFYRPRLVIENKNVAVVFDPAPADYYMRNNKKDEDACCTLFKHSIIYSEQPQKEITVTEDANDTPSAMIKLKD